MIAGGVAIWRSVVARRHGKHSAHAANVASADAAEVPVTSAVFMEQVPPGVAAVEQPVLDAPAVPEPDVVAPVLVAPVLDAPAVAVPAPVLDTPIVNPPAVPTALDPMLIAPWTHVEQATSLGATAAPEVVPSGAESGTSEPAVWESPEWIAPATTIDPASAPVSEAE
jgi:ribonuclease E